MDGALKAEVKEPPGPVRALHLTSPLVLGASVDYRDGYVGCIRAMLLNGQLQDLKRYAQLGLYGKFIILICQAVHKCFSCVPCV